MGEVFNLRTYEVDIPRRADEQLSLPVRERVPELIAELERIVYVDLGSRGEPDWVIDLKQELQRIDALLTVHLVTNHPGCLPRRDRTSRATKDLYFARSLLGGDLIKIGVSNNVPERMKALHAEAIVVVPNRADMEGMLHMRFGPHRVKGEWFRPAPEILEFIERMRLRPAA